jgi:acetyl-CoA carboxylase carboxyltransferase component
MGQNPFDHQTATFALPTATVGAMPAKGGSAAAKADEDTADALAELEAGGPWRMADTLSYDDVIAPSELRNRLLDAVRRAPAGRATGAVGPVTRIGHLP